VSKNKQCCENCDWYEPWNEKCGECLNSKNPLQIPRRDLITDYNATCEHWELKKEGEED